MYTSYLIPYRNYRKIFGQSLPHFAQIFNQMQLIVIGSNSLKNP